MIVVLQDQSEGASDGRQRLHGESANTLTPESVSLTDLFTGTKRSH